MNYHILRTFLSVTILLLTIVTICYYYKKASLKTKRHITILIIII